MTSPVQKLYVLSPLQLGLLFHSLRAPAAGLYVDQLQLDLAGEVDATVLQQAWQAVVARHDVLRTSFHWQGLDKPLQVVHPAVELPFSTLDWRGLEATEREPRLAALADTDRRRGFSLERPPLLRLTLVRTGNASSVLLWTQHHLLCDGWSIGVLQREVAACYRALRRGEAPRLAPPRPFGEYIAWLRRRDDAAAEAFWRRRMAGVEPPALPGVGLPAATDAVAAAAPAAGAAGAPGAPAAEPDHDECERALTSGVTAALNAFARRHRLTVNTVLQGAWALLAGRLSGAGEVVFGATVSGRPAEIAGIDAMVGLFINTLPVRLRIDEAAPLAGWLQGVQGEQAAALPFQHSSLAEIQQWSGAPAGQPLFETLLVFENVPGVVPTSGQTAAANQAADDLGVVGSRYVSRTNFPLVLMVIPGEQLVVRAIFDRRRLAPAAAGRLLDRLTDLLAALPGLGEATPVAAVPVLRPEEIRQLAALANDTAVDYPRDATVAELFAAVAAADAERIALDFDGVSVSYGELAARAGRLAARLRRLGVAVEERVALCVEPSPELVVGMLGTLLAGAAYAPLDAAHPRRRLAQLLEDLGRPLLLTAGRAAATAAALAPACRSLVRIEEAAVPLPPSQSAAGMPRATLAAAPSAGGGGERLAAVLFTSGSTGRPKGVMVTHRGIVRLVRGDGAVTALRAARVAQLSNVAFDALSYEVWAPLLAGGCLVGVPRQVALAPGDLAARLRRDQISAMFLTAALFNQVAREAPAAFACVDQVIAGGEALDPRWISEVLRHGPPARLVNGYGPTESTTFATTYLVTQGWQDSIPIGYPIANTRVHVLDGAWRLLPIGATGELAIGGDGLARGYLDRPDLTAERFVPDPYAAAPGERLYRTGDRARRRADGAVEFAGRNDLQVKIRGFRIEPGEIEAAILAAAPQLAAAVVLAVDAGAAGDGAGDSAGDRRLVACLVAGDGAIPGGGGGDLAAGLRQRLAEVLPPVMVPAAFAVLPRLPVTANGKVDRGALAAAAAAALAAGGGRQGGGEEDGDGAPRTPVEELLAGIWAAVLGVEQVRRNDDFLRLGGHSLLLTRLLSRVREAFGVEIALADLIATPALAEQAAWIAQAMRRDDGAAAVPPLAPAPRDRPLPLSYAQQRLWILDRFDPGLPAYDIPLATHLAGRLAVGDLAAALAGVVARHEVLRTRFVAAAEGEEPQQLVAPPPATAAVRLPVVDLAALPAAARAAQLRQLLHGESARRFDLARGPLFVATLARLSEGEHVLVLNVHHIVADGASLGILFREVAALYADRAAPLPPLPVQYADYAIWQRGWLHGAVLDRQIAYWREHLAGASPLGLPTDRPRPPVRSFRGSHVPVPLAPALAVPLWARARDERATPFMLLLAAWFEMQGRLAGRADLTVGTPVGNRDRLPAEGLIGFFVNTLVLRADVGGRPSGRELLARVRQTALAAWSHQDVPFEKLVEELQPQRSLALAPFFQVLVALDQPPPPPHLGDLAATPVEIESATAKFEITLALSLGDGALAAALDYNSDLFDRTTARRFAGHYATLLAALLADPERPAGDLPMLSAGERHQLLAEWNDAGLAASRALSALAAAGPAATLDRLFARQAAATPAAPALIHGAERLTYQELDRRANRLAHRLAAAGVAPEVPVAIFLDRTAAMVVAVLAVLKAGGAYVPLDPAYPAERLAQTLAACRAPVVVTRAVLRDRLPAAPAAPAGGGGGAVARLLVEVDAADLAALPDTPPPAAAQSHNLAYLIYTSGSTGRPKGVAIEHASAVALLRWTAAAFADDELAVTVAATSLCFDLSVFELFAPLTRGGAVELVGSALDLAAGRGRRGAAAGAAGDGGDGTGGTGGTRGAGAAATLLNTVPSAVAELVGAGALPPALRTLNMAGEPIPAALAARLAAAGPARILNMYGPSEATTYSTWARVEPAEAGPPPIGRPIAGTALYLLDGELRPVPIGTPGQLWLGGEGLARGYFSAPDQTAAAFLPHPFAEGGQRLYRTGDLARARADGRCEFLGRIDHQVKVRGFRIELGEIEAALRLHPAVAAAAAAVLPGQTAPEDRRLVAYVVPREPAAGAAAPVILEGDLRALMRARLPEFMLPAAFVTLAALPLSPNGKLDRAALPAPDGVRRAAAPFVEAGNAVERTVAGAVGEVLGLDRVGLNDNFFDLGGHSLQLVRAASLCEKRLGRRVDALDFFRFPNVAALAAHLAAPPAGAAGHAGDAGEQTPPPAMDPPAPATPPLAAFAPPALAATAATAGERQPLTDRALRRAVRRQAAGVAVPADPRDPV